jgi:helicase
MTTKGLFIGVNRHADVRVRELQGAARDALALHALFVDSLPGMVATLLIDADATLDCVATELARTLGNAGPDDVVLVSFSGHGTRSHRLVPFDLNCDRTEETSYCMGELARLFKASRARAILCILDCCFSGGAPARVLEDSPAPRNVVVELDELAGEGRILIAASNTNEPAWETPGSGHGLLTKAVIDSLLEAEGPVDIQEAMARVMAIVRTEALRIGVVQTPVLVGKVTGGLVMPPLQRGPAYFAAFPDRRGATATPDIRGLAAFGIPSLLLDAWSQSFAKGLNDLQVRAVNDGRVLDGNSLLVVAPTSSGKTFVGELAAARAVTEGKKAVFLVPYRALVAEKYDTFAQLYGPLGLRVLRCSGDYQDQISDFVLSRYDLAILTFEMFLQLTVDRPDVLSSLGLVVLDEAQFITDPRRGINVELLLTLLLRARTRGTTLQLVALSAVISDVNLFDEWLGIDKIVHTKRPVPLTEGVLDRQGVFVFADGSGQRREMRLLAAHEIVQRRDKPSAQDVLVPLAQKLIAQGETLIVFRNRRGSARGSARYLASDLSLPPAANALSELNTADPSSATADLRQCLRGGTAFHTTDLSRDEKSLVEREFRRKDSAIRAIVSTTTLAAGVNTPASTVVLAEQEFVGEDGRPFSVAEYKNMAGRAGRLEFRAEGRSIIYAETPFERERLFARYVLGSPEPLRSSFDVSAMSTWVLRLLSHVHQVPRHEVVALLANTYGGYLAARANPQWGARTTAELEDILHEMLRLKLLEEEDNRVQLTLLGRACGRSSLSFRSCMRLVDVLHGLSGRQLTGEMLMALVQLLPESDNGYTPLMRRGQAERNRAAAVTKRFGPVITQLLQKFAEDDWDWLGRCKRAAILWDWINGVRTDTIEREYSPNSYQGTIALGDILKFADATRFHLRSAQQIASVMLIPGCPDELVLDQLGRRLQVGIPVAALGLLELPLTLDRGTLLALCVAGIRTREALSTLDRDAVTASVGSAVAAALDEAGCLRPMQPDNEGAA